jgi:hypothetical protein
MCAAALAVVVNSTGCEISVMFTVKVNGAKFCNHDINSLAALSLLLLLQFKTVIVQVTYHQSLHMPADSISIQE